MRYVEEDTSEGALDKAKEELAAFEAKVKGKNRLTRLRLSAPRHPVLMGMTFTVLSAAVMIVLAVSVAVAPLVMETGIARQFAQVPGIDLLPGAMLALAVCAAILYGLLYTMALNLGDAAPLLPPDLREHTRLRSTVQRFTVAQDVHRRLTGTPAPARTRQE